MKEVAARTSAATSARLARVAVHAPFFRPLIDSHPDWLADLDETSLRQPKPREQLDRELRTALGTTLGDESATILRDFKYRNLLRTTIRELCTDIVPTPNEGEILLELSDLADCLLAASLECADRALRQRLKVPACHPIRGFVVFALGKLGAQELNYSSDVDLVYVFDATAETGERAPIEYSTRLAQEFTRFVSLKGPSGFLYRVDIELRPEGSRGPLVTADDAFVDYYDTWAATWERAAALKLRPVAGDLDLGWKCVRQLAPILHRSTTDHETVAAIFDMKQRSRAAVDPASYDFNVKHGPGGIRDVESITQALQLLHGGRIPQIRLRGTEAAIRALGEVHLIESTDTEEILESYRLLRRLEHRVQMFAEQQVYSLPDAEADLDRVARSLDHSDRSEMLTVLSHHRQRVVALLHRYFPEDTSERVLELMSRRAPSLVANAVTREPLEQLAQHFARAVEECPDPQRALANLEHFLDGLGARRFYYGLLSDRPELVPRLTSVFASSELLSAYLSRYPRLIEPIFDDPSILIPTHAQLTAEYHQLEAQLTVENGDSSTETHLDALRLFHHRQMVNIGLLDLAQKITRHETEAALTEIATVCVERAVPLAEQQIKHIAKPNGDSGFVVVGMGKFATAELTYGSDLDVIFLYDSGDANNLDAQAYFARLAQKLIWAICTPTATGVCYEVDARLRPSGNQGPLVTSFSGFRAYHQQGAQAWERQALLRARVVAGDLSRSAAFDDLRREILRTPLPADLAHQIHHIRSRMEKELGRETNTRHNFKTGVGGLLDIESVIQFLQLTHGPAHPELYDPVPLPQMIERLRERELLAETDAADLAASWEFLQRLSSRLRIVENRSISDLDEERRDLDSLARSLGFGSAQRQGGARRALLAEYASRTRAAREIYRRHLAPEPS